jgi:hypothetical protein
MEQVANDFGVQMMIGRAMLEPDFGVRLMKDAASISREFLGAGQSAKKAVAIFNTAGFKKLKGFSEARQALDKIGAGKRFSEGVANGRARVKTRGAARPG